MHLRKLFNHSMLDLVVKPVQSIRNHSGRARTRNGKEKGITTLDLTKAAILMQVQKPNNNAKIVINFILESVGSKTSLGATNATSLGTL